MSLRRQCVLFAPTLPVPLLQQTTRLHKFAPDHLLHLPKADRLEYLDIYPKYPIRLFPLSPMRSLAPDHFSNLHLDKCYARVFQSPSDFCLANILLYVPVRPRKLSLHIPAFSRPHQQFFHLYKLLPITIWTGAPGSQSSVRRLVPKLQ